MTLQKVLKSKADAAVKNKMQQKHWESIEKQLVAAAERGQYSLTIVCHN